MEKTDFSKVAQENLSFLFNSSLQAQQATEKMVYGMIEACVAAQEAQIKVAKEYFNTLGNLQRELLKRSNEATEKVFEAGFRFATATK
ncbi:MAG: hypothetical protein RMM17_13415 [Acidobacteriota bacterium]|nr:hypothetical protein [Blastocatellia bacterium]MDW8413667.1 hypothetical protein [Acidobacteriota bacterium]